MSHSIYVTASIENASTGARVYHRQALTTGEGNSLSVVEIGTAEEEISVPAAIATPGSVWIRNLSTVDYLRVGFASGDYPIKIPAGGVALVPLNEGVASLFMVASHLWSEDVNFTADAGTNVCTCAAAAVCTENKAVRVSSTGTLPAGLSADTTYYMVSADNNADTFKLSLTESGSEIDITDAGTGTHTLWIENESAAACDVAMYFQEG